MTPCSKLLVSNKLMGNYEKIIVKYYLSFFFRFYTELQENVIIRKPLKYNNTKLFDFISENKYKINDPKELEELQISSDMLETCYWGNREYIKTKPNRVIKKPPGLYQAIMNNRKPNTCPHKQYLNENKVQTKTANNLKENGIKLSVSLKTLFD